MMSTSSSFYSLLIIIISSTILTTTAKSPYLSPSTFHQDYNTMLSTFKLHPYTLNTTPPINTTAPSSSPIHLFHSTLLHFPNTFFTDHPTAAHLFYLPFPPNLSSRSLFHEINSIRSSHPYWDRSLGADHVFLSSCTGGTPPNSARNVVELRKNAIQITCVATPPGNFVPHKDIALPPLPLTINTQAQAAAAPPNKSTPQRLAYYFNSNPDNSSDLFKSLHHDPDFLIDTNNPVDYSHSIINMMQTSRFCLFIHSPTTIHDQLRGLAEAMSVGCVPVIISLHNHPLHDMPLMDVLRWQDMAVFVGSTVLRSNGLTKVLLDKVNNNGGGYEMMRELCMVAAKHLTWNQDGPKPYDAFHMVVYQLWRRRHVVRYEAAEDIY